MRPWLPLVVTVSTILLVSLATAAGAFAGAPRVRSGDKSFRDCPTCPLMMPVPAGEFLMGSPDSEARRNPDEGPQHRVAIREPFAISKFEITFAEWDQCVAKGGCTHKPDDEGWGRGRQPVVNISWSDAKAYVKWLADSTGQSYRLASEAEWEYAARGLTSAEAPAVPFSTGTTIGYKQANYDANFVYGPGRIGVYRQKPIEVGSLPRNAFGLHDMHGNVWEWVEDCYRPDYRNAPADGSAVSSADCKLRILRGGAWNYYPWALRSAYRYATPGDVRLSNVGLRVARNM